MLCALPLMLSAACMEPPPQRPLPTIETRIEGNGTEPFWSVTIDGEHIRFERPGMPVIRERHRPVQHAHVHDVYSTRTMTVRIGFNSCSDGMSDRRYSRTMEVRVGRERYRGCADMVASAEQLAGRRFRIAMVDDTRLAPASGATLTFERRRLSGSAGCNRIMGGWRVERDRLVAGRIAMTRRACPGPAMATERRLGEIMATPLTVVLQSQGRLILTGGEGGRIALEEIRN